MDVYQSTIEYLMKLSIFNSWEGMESILRRAASTQPRDWNLPILTCQAVGEAPEKAIPASAALACAQISIILIDDMLDDDPRGEFRRIGGGRAANLAAAFQAAGMEALLESGARSKVREEAVKSLSHMMSVTAFGQELDVRNPADETSYWKVVEKKARRSMGARSISAHCWGMQ
jgi:geranylgeranyl pyrophosphate synthase